MLRFTQRLCNYISIEEVYRVVQAKLAQLPSACETQLIDVRSTNEVAESGMIPTAINIPLTILSDVLNSFDEVDDDNEYGNENCALTQEPKINKQVEREQKWAWKSYLNKCIVTDDMFRYTFGVDRPNKDNTQLIFYCTHGIRSATAVEIAEELGYKHVYNFSGS